mgnify:FL=1
MIGPEDREALDALLAHPGWRLFRAHVGEAWGPVAYANRLKAALGHARSVGSDVARAIDGVDAANEAIAEIMRWPAEEVARARRAQEEPVASLGRRGGL